MLACFNILVFINFIQAFRFILFSCNCSKHSLSLSLFFFSLSLSDTARTPLRTIHLYNFFPPARCLPPPTPVTPSPTTPHEQRLHRSLPCSTLAGPVINCSPVHAPLPCLCLSPPWPPALASGAAAERLHQTKIKLYLVSCSPAPHHSPSLHSLVSSPSTPPSQPLLR